MKCVTHLLFVCVLLQRAVFLFVIVFCEMCDGLIMCLRFVAKSSVCVCVYFVLVLVKCVTHLLCVCLLLQRSVGEGTSVQGRCHIT